MKNTAKLLVLFGSIALAGCGTPSEPSPDATPVTPTDPANWADSEPLPTDLEPRRIETH